LSLISNVFTERGERARAIGLWGATIGAAVALGPIVGGWLLEQFSWTSIFFAMAPVAFFALSGFSFLITQYFQFFKGYAPLSTGVRLLPVAIAVAVTSVLGTQLAVRFGTKQVVTAGLVCSAGFFAWVSTADTGTSYLEIVG